MQYYQVKALPKKGSKDYDCEVLKEDKQTYEIDDDQMQDMESAAQFSKEEKVSRSAIVEHLINAKQCIFTVTFRKKVDAKDIEEKLRSLKKDSELKDKGLAKELSEGEKVTLTCYLTKSEHDLGRSLVIDLQKEWGKGFR